MSSALQAALEDSYRHALPMRQGTLPDYIPQLANVDPELFAAAVCTVDGEVSCVGPADHLFTLQSVSKPFVYALALERCGLEQVHAKVDVEPSGYAFYSMIRLQEGTNKPHNPMINAGAIAVTDLLRHRNPAGATTEILEFTGRCAGRPSMDVDDSVFQSERTTGDRNRAIAYLMRHFGMIEGPVPETLDLYFRHCSILASCRDLSVMAATLANRGQCPVTRRQVVPSALIQYVLTVMFTNGLYDHSGRFAFEVGIPAKSGVSGAILAVSPGRLGVGVFSPRLDTGGNSVRGLAALRFLAEREQLHTFHVE